MLKQLRWAILLLAATLTAFGQTEKAQINGVISDPSGSVIAGAEIVLTNLQTGVKRTVTTNAAGLYNLPLLDPGSYEVLAKAPGFRQRSQTGIELHVGDNARVDFQLKVGEVTESIEVTAAAPLINSDNAELGQVVDNELVNTLPLLERSVMQLTYLTPGLTPAAEGGNAGGLDPHTGTNWVSNGGRNSTSGVMLDGVNNTAGEGSGSGMNWLLYTPAVDSVREFKVQTNTFSAQYGGGGTTIVNMASKSGTNEFHGTLFEFRRDSVLNANSFFSNRVGAGLPDASRNQYGGVIGGPVKRNRTFFFGSFEGGRAETIDARYVTVPTPAERGGDFSKSLAPNGAPVSIFDPYNTFNEAGTVLRQPFPGNIIPASRINPVAATVIKYYPDPNLPNSPTGTSQNYFNQGIFARGSKQMDLKGDHNISDKQRLNIRYGFNAWYEEVPIIYGGIAQPYHNGDRTNRNHSAGVEYTRIQNASTVISIRYGMLRQFWFHKPLSYGLDPASLGLPAYMRSSGEWLFPRFNMENYGAIGNVGSGLIRRGDLAHSFVGSVTKTQGAQTLKVGAETRFLMMNKFQPNYPTGTFTFNARDTGQNPLTTSTTQGNGIATMLMGWPRSGSYLMASPASSAAKYFGFYVQDDWRVTRRLTLNLGIRYEFDLPRTERYNRYSWIDLSEASPIAGKAPGYPNLKGVYHFADGSQRSPFSCDCNNIQPRFGIAYSLGNKTAIRAGYGIYYTRAAGGEPLGSLADAFSTTTSLNYSLDSGRTPYATLTNPYPDGLKLPPGRAGGALTNLGLGVGPTTRNVSPSGQSWNLSLQRMLPGKGLLEVNYTGAKGTHLYFGGSLENLNVLDPSYWGWGRAELSKTVPNPFYGVITDPTSTLSQPNIVLNQLLKPYPQYSGVSRSPGDIAFASSIYHALQLKYEKRFSNGLSVLAHYTWSKAIDDSSFYGGQNWLNSSTTIQAYHNLRLERSLSANDIPHRVVLSYSYQLPFGRNKAIGRNMSRWLDVAIGGWGASGFVQVQTGYPILPAMGGGQLWVGAQRPDLIGDPGTKGELATRLDQYFNVAAFAKPLPDVYGTAPRSLNYRTPGLHNGDLSLLKRIPVTERKKLEFRVELFNATNTPTFGRPASSFNSTGFGRITGYAPGRGAREIQLGVKFYY